MLGLVLGLRLKPGTVLIKLSVLHGGIAWILISDYDDLSNHLYSNRRIVAMELYGPLINKQLIFASIPRSSVGLNYHFADAWFESCWKFLFI